jgi:hypothetical protein
MTGEQDTPFGNQEVANLLDQERPQAWIAEEPGDQIVGTLVRYDKGTSQYGEADIAVVRTKDGERAVWMFGAALRSQFGKIKPSPGEVVGIKFLGERVSGAGNKYKDWRVVVDRPAATPDFESMAGEVEP